MSYFAPAAILRRVLAGAPEWIALPIIGTVGYEQRMILSCRLRSDGS
jgi:hypothetical protein